MVVGDVMGSIPLKVYRMDVCADHSTQFDRVPLAFYATEEIQNSLSSGCGLYLDKRSFSSIPHDCWSDVRWNTDELVRCYRFCRGQIDKALKSQGPA